MTLEQLETLQAHYDSHIRLGDFMDAADAREWIRSDNKLLDLCVDAGMNYDTSNHEAWAARQIAFTNPVDTHAI